LPINADDARGDGRAVKFEGATCVDAHGLDAAELWDLHTGLATGFTPAARMMVEHLFRHHPHCAVPKPEARREARLLMLEAEVLLTIHNVGSHLLLPGATPPLPPTPTAQSTVQCGWSGAVRVECARADAFVE